MKSLRFAGILLHLVIAITAIALMHQHYRQRQTEVAAVEVNVRHQRSETERIERDVAVQQQLLGGIREGDPFVVELLARERLDLTRPGEIAPPPAALPAR